MPKPIQWLASLGVGFVDVATDLTDQAADPGAIVIAKDTGERLKLVNGAWKTADPITHGSFDPIAPSTELLVVTTTKEPWDVTASVQSRWDSPTFTIPAYGKVTSVQQSDAFKSYQKWDRRHDITVSTTISGKVAVGSSSPTKYYVGVALYQNDGNDNRYGSIAAQCDVQSPFNLDHIPRVVSLTQQLSDVRCVSLLVDDTPGVEHQIEIRYIAGTAKVYYYVDAVLKKQEPLVFTQDPCIWLGVVSVTSGQGNDGSLAEGTFGMVSVTGVRIT